ncbi:MAG: nucleotide exchange factor GrpE [Coriobacteriales bacterium]|jgi:molecular chaperone GrpE|nr:nucleotide exchange factor GrpE [Coriobacteriales bacterium]
MVSKKGTNTGTVPADTPTGVDHPIDPGTLGTAGMSQKQTANIKDTEADVTVVASAGEAASTVCAPDAHGVSGTGDPVSASDSVTTDACEDFGKAEELFAEELDELGQARAEAAEMRDRFMRLQAEWDNFRKRTAVEREQERIRAAERLVERLLPVVDDLERAIEHSDTANEASLKEGIAAVYSKLSEVLEREGLKTIDPTGEPFDANLHQAVGKEADANVPDETVTQVNQKGFGMGDRVLRPAMVVVSQGGPRQETE